MDAVFRTSSKDLSAQEVNLSVPGTCYTTILRSVSQTPQLALSRIHDMELARTVNRYIIAALIMLSIWAYVTATSAAPGWIHLLLTAGVFSLIYGIVVKPGDERQ